MAIIPEWLHATLDQNADANHERAQAAKTPEPSECGHGAGNPCRTCARRDALNGLSPIARYMSGGDQP